MKSLLLIAGLLLTASHVSLQAQTIWQLTNDQKMQRPNQLKVFYNVCTGEYQYVWPTGDAPGVHSSPRLRVGQTVMLELIGINPMHYEQLKLNGISRSLQSEEPKGLANFTSILERSAAKPTTESTERDSISAGRLALSNYSVTDRFSQLEGRTARAEVNTTLSRIYSINNELRDIETALNVQKQRVTALNALLTKMAAFRQALANRSCFLATEYNRIREPLRQQVETFVGSDVNMDDPVALTAAFNQVYSDYVNAYEEAKQRLDTLDRQTNELAKHVLSEKALRQKDGATNAVALRDLQKEMGKTQNAVNQYGATIPAIRKLPNAVNASSVEELCQAFVTGQQLVVERVIMHPFQAEENADEVHLKAVGQRKDPSDAKKMIDESLVDLNLPIIGGWKIDFSVGGVFSTLVDHNYVVRRAENEEGEARYWIEPNPERWGFVVTTNAHAIYRVASNLGVGVHLGTGVDLLNKQRVRLLLGGTIRAGGALDNLLINAGLVMGPVKRLSTERQVGVPYDSDIETVPTYDTFKPGFYVGASYILGRNKTKK